MADADHITTPGKSPAFQFYPADFISGTIDLSAEDVGAYIRLLCYQWEKGSVPSNMTAQGRIAGLTTLRMKGTWSRLHRHFADGPDGSFQNRRLERVRQGQILYRNKQSAKGKASAASRKATTVQPDGNHGSTTVDSRLQPQTQPEANSLSPSLSSDFSQKTNVRAFKASEPDGLSERAGIFVRETYPALYAKHRKGARYVSKPNLDFLEAVELCRVWDDDRLAKIATVFLTTDHQFAESGSRTMAQFRALASWCDSRLAEAGIA